jgi:hypothetical protein
VRSTKIVTDEIKWDLDPLSEHFATWALQRTGINVVLVLTDLSKIKRPFIAGNQNDTDFKYDAAW